MSSILSVFVAVALLLLFPVFIFWMFVRAIRSPGTRWWGIIILLSVLTCYCTTLTAIIGLVAGGNATGSAAMEQRYCERFREVLTQTETLSGALDRMDAVSADDDYQVMAPEKDLRFRYVWLLGGCLLFAIANLMMFGPGRREHRHPADCSVAVSAALVVFLTGIWQIAWGNGYAYQAAAYRRMLAGWHESIRLDAIHASNAEIAAQLSEDGVKNLNGLWRAFLELSGEKIPGMPDKKEKPAESAPAAAGTGPGVAIIGGADGPTAVFIGSELLRQQGSAPAESAEETDSGTEASAAEENAAF